MGWNIYIASCHRKGGIYHYTMDDTGKCTYVAFSTVDRPMYMTISQSRMYVILRDPWDKGISGVVSFELDRFGFLRNPSVIQSTKGSVACHILADRGEVFCTNYQSGSVIKMPDTLVQHTGCGPDRKRQEMSHPHYVGLTPDQKYVCVADLGTDTIYLYDRDMKLHSQVRGPSGHGVRHLAFDDSGRYLLSSNELKSTVSVYSYEKGKLKLLHTVSAVPENFAGETYAAAIRIHGDEIYISNRGHDSVARMKFHKGDVTLVDFLDSRGKTPRDIQLAGSYLLTANQDSDTVAVVNLAENNCVTDLLQIHSPLCIFVAESTKKFGDAE